MTEIPDTRPPGVYAKDSWPPPGIKFCACKNVGAHPVRGRCINGAEPNDPDDLCQTCRASLS